jgi:hypothetical protein
VAPAECASLCAPCSCTGPCLPRGARGTWCAQDGGSWKHGGLSVRLALLPGRRLVTTMGRLIIILWQLQDCWGGCQEVVCLWMLSTDCCWRHGAIII